MVRYGPLDIKGPQSAPKKFHPSSNSDMKIEDLIDEEVLIVRFSYTSFFIETNFGNFFWTEPCFDEVNYINPTYLTFDQAVKIFSSPFSNRVKEKHILGKFCGSNLVIGKHKNSKEEMLA